MTRSLGLCLAVCGILWSGLADTTGEELSRSETYVAVFLVRGSVAGANRGEYGIFRRTSDTSWERLSRSNVISFGVERSAGKAGERLYLAAGNGLHRSTDRGKSWKILTSWHTMEIMHALVDPTDDARLYVGTPWGVYRSTDDGSGWQPMMEGMRRWYISDLAMDPVNPRTLYASSEDDLYRSTDGGERWSPLGVGAAPVNVVALRPGTSPWIIAGIEDGGVRLSEDRGAHWRATTGLEGASVYALAYATDGSRAYAAGWQTGLWVSPDAGRHWEQLWDAPGIESIFCITVDPFDQRHLLLGTDGQGVVETTDGGQRWRAVGLDGGKIKDIKIYPVE